MWNRIFIIKDKPASTKVCIYMLVVVLLVLAITIISMLVWQEKKLHTISDLGIIG